MPKLTAIVSPEAVLSTELLRVVLLNRCRQVGATGDTETMIEAVAALDRVLAKQPPQVRPKLAAQQSKPGPKIGG